MDVITMSWLSIPSILAADSDGLISNSQMAILAFVIGATVLVMISTRRRIRDSQNTPRAYAREHLTRIKEERAVMGDVESVMLQLEQLAREMTGKIDTRFAKLEKSIRDADARIAELQRLIRAADGNAGVDLIVDDSGPSLEPTSEVGDRYGSIRQLHAAGLSPVQIAEQTGQATGEVELILALHRDGVTQQ